MQVGYSVVLIDEGRQLFKIREITEEVTNEFQLLTVGYDAADKIRVLVLE